MDQRLQVEDQIHDLYEREKRSRNRAMRRRNLKFRTHLSCSRASSSLLWFRAPLHIGHKAVTSACQGLDEARAAGGIAQHFAQLVHSRVQAVIEIHESIGRPKTLPQFLTGDYGPSTFQQESQHCKRLLLQAQLAVLFAQLPRSQISFEDAEAGRLRA